MIYLNQLGHSLAKVCCPGFEDALSAAVRSALTQGAGVIESGNPTKVKGICLRRRHRFAGLFGA